MKNTRNLWRVVTLALAMIMLFSVVACQNGGDTTQTTAGNGTTLAPGTNAPTTEKPTTEKPTTEKPATTPAPTTTPEPTEAPKVEVPMESTFGGTYTFSNYLPAIFTTDAAILLAGADHLESDLGVSSLAVADIYHYYIDLNEKKREDGSVIEHADKSLTWKFTVPEDGTYNFCFQMRMKDGAQRGNVVQIDDGEKTSMDFQFKDGAEAAVRDDVLNSYMTGYSAYLTAGEHTIKMTYAQECPKTFHFRNIYVVNANTPEPPKPASVWDGVADTSWYDPANPQTEYTITTAAQFAGIMTLRQSGKGELTFAGVTFKLDCDIVLNPGTATEIQNNRASCFQVEPLNFNYSFCGTFDGQGHYISGVYLDCGSSGVKGLFGGLGDNAVIKNLTIKNGYYDGPEKSKNVGAFLAARANGTNIVLSNITIEDCLMQESDSAFERIALLIGKTDEGKSLTIENCHIKNCTINFPTVGLRAASLIGYVSASSTLNIVDCTADTTINVTEAAGGLIGYITVPEDPATAPVVTITNSTFTGTLNVAEGATKGTLVGNIPDFGNEEPAPEVDPDAPVADTAYKFALVQGNLEGKTLYFTGKMDGYYLATSENVADAVDVFVEITDGQYRLFFMDGETKTYIEVYERQAGEAGKGKAGVQLVTETPANYYTFDSTLKLLIHTSADGLNTYYLGTYNTYNTMSASNTYYITGEKAADLDVTQFPSRLVVVEVVDPNAPEIIPDFGADALSKELPEAYKNATIVIEASSCEANTANIFTQKENSTYHLYTPEGNAGASANGVIKLIQSGVFHYYIDPNAAKIKEANGGNGLATEDCYIRWTFTVTEPGTYTICSYMRIKNSAERFCQVQFDDQRPMIMKYTVTDADVNAVNDGTQGAYLTWTGVEVELEAGEHTITYTIPEGAKVSSWHWRTIYLMKK
ncbi:MAG: hypothetical protein IJX28_01925 [Clostridia bacterium]|nr:hypothetical protein [Clostridia bacterium]